MREKEKMIKLFCIPGGAASATAYLPWTKLLDRDIRLCLLEVPGRGLRRNEESLKTMDAVADDLFNNLKSQLKEDDEYMILGYCFGAVAGYELYRRIEASGIKLPFRAYFCASDPPDGNTYKTSIFSDRNREEELQETLKRYFHPALFRNEEELDSFVQKYTSLCYRNYETFGKVISIKPTELFADYEEHKDEYYDRCKALDFANHTMDLLDIDQKIVQTYQNGENEYFKIQTPVTVFAGNRDTMTTLDAVKGWERVSGDKFDLRVIDGGHLILIDGYQNCIPIINEIVQNYKETGRD